MTKFCEVCDGQYHGFSVRPEDEIPCLLADLTVDQYSRQGGHMGGGPDWPTAARINPSNLSSLKTLR